MSSWSDRNVLITGATGLVGSWLASMLAERGANVTALVRDDVPGSILWSPEFAAARKRLSIVRGSLDDISTIERALNEYEIETVFHLGAQTIVGIANRSPLSTFEANIRGTYMLLEACRRVGPLVKAVVVASSDKAYGDQQKLPYTEDTALEGRHPYDVSKSCADLIAISYWHTYKLPVCVTRCGNFYGPGDLNFNRIIPGTIRSILRGQKPIIRSDGTYTRDYFYVKDGALAYLFLAEKMLSEGIAGESFNFSNETPASVLEVVERVASAMKVKPEPLILNEASGEIKHQYLSAARAKTRLGWKPQWSFESGLAETIAWYKAYLKA